MSVDISNADIHISAALLAPSLAIVSVGESPLRATCAQVQWKRRRMSRDTARVVARRRGWHALPHVSRAAFDLRVACVISWRWPSGTLGSYEHPA